jgi:polyisoprenoid-binding protein YceI
MFKLESRRVFTTIAVLSVLGAGATAGTAERVHVASGDVTVVCPLTVGGSFEAKTKALSGDIMSARQQNGAVDGELQVRLDTLETGIALRDHHMRENYLEVGRGAGYETAVIEAIQLDAADGKTGFKGTMSLHGMKHAVAGTAVIKRHADGSAHVDAEFPLKVSDFQIPKPSYLGVGVRDEVQVKVSFAMAPAATAATR